MKIVEHRPSGAVVKVISSDATVLEVNMLIENNKTRFSTLAAAAVGAIALGIMAMPTTAKAQVYFDIGPVAVGVGPPGPYYYHHRYWGYPGPYYAPYGYYPW